MYLSEIRLWNFRKYGIQGDEYEKADPGVVARLNPGLNVLIGENDSGKTALVDAVRYLLGTQSREWTRLDEEDFHQSGAVRATQLKIECVFRGFSHIEAGPFLEWMGTEEVEEKKQYVLNVGLTAKRRADRIITDLRAGPDPIGAAIDGEARELLRVTYLKPLRDAQNELTPGVRSRFAQILKAHDLFQKSTSGTIKTHPLEKIVETANKGINKYFKPSKADSASEDKGADKTAGELTRTLNNFLEEFFPEGSKPEACVGITGGELFEILRRLQLTLEENKSGLGSLNLLYIAAELLLLQSSSFHGLRLALIEELEAHLHPQAQLRLVHFLHRHSTSAKGQFILTTHSTTLGASIDLKNMIICKDGKVFPMGPDFTELDPKNYEFLQRFLDATKANLFFARGVILVEGVAENILLPTIAEIIGRPLYRYGVSIVNVGSTAFLHYAKIFHRKDGLASGMRVSVITDMDVKPLEWVDDKGKSPTEKQIRECKRNRLDSLSSLTADGVEIFVSPNWTLEYEISSSWFYKRFYNAVLWAEKKQNAKTGIPRVGKYKEVQTQSYEDIERWKTTWKSDDRKQERIAFEIYQKTMIKKDISKAVTAQVFADSLTKGSSKERVKKVFREKFQEPESLKYLIDAICHVTEPL